MLLQYSERISELEKELKDLRDDVSCLMYVCACMHICPRYETITLHAGIALKLLYFF